MCDRYSWIEVTQDKVVGRKVKKVKEILFITEDILKDVKLVRKLVGYGKKVVENDWGHLGDLVGHEAIRVYYGIPGDARCIEHEETRLDKPSRFPLPIQKAIKAGKMIGLGINQHMMNGLLTHKAYSELMMIFEKENLYIGDNQKRVTEEFRKVWRYKANRKECWR